MNKIENKNNPKPISKNNYVIIQIAAFISVYKQNMKGVVRLQFWLDPQRYANGISIAKYRITIILHPVIPNIITIHLHHLCAFANVIITLLTI